MQKLNFPAYHFKMLEKEGKNFIFDSIRKIYVRLTPEEWVRQHLVKYLQDEKKYPGGLISIENYFKVSRRTKRGDIVVFGTSGRPILLAECKAPEVSINQSVFDQAVRYNFTLKVDYIIISNGLKHFCCKIDYNNMDYRFLKDIPSYNEL